jgi:inhibitor of cysteine peptidase
MSPMAELVVTEQDTNKTFDLRVGDTVSIRLPENPTSGYRWNLEQVTDDLVSVDSSEFDQSPGSGVGGAGVRTIKLSAGAPGLTHVVLKNQRPWERTAVPVDQFEATFNITSTR